jgi:predicted dehydrogenase
VFGRRAWVEFRNESHPDTIGETTLTLKPASGAEQSRVFSWTDSVKANLEAFADAAERRAPYPFTASQKLETVAVIEAAVISAATGQATTVAS